MPQPLVVATFQHKLMSPCGDIEGRASPGRGDRTRGFLVKWPRALVTHMPGEANPKHALGEGSVCQQPPWSWACSGRSAPILPVVKG